MHKIPWGLILLGVGGYLLYRRSQGQSLLPGMATTTTTSAADARTYIEAWTSNNFGQNSPEAQWARTAPDEDIVRLSNVIHVWAYKQADGTEYGYCPNSGPGTYPQCYADWQYIKTKYPNVFTSIKY